MPNGNYLVHYSIETNGFRTSGQSEINPNISSFSSVPSSQHISNGSYEYDGSVITNEMSRTERIVSSSSVDTSKIDLSDIELCVDIPYANENNSSSVICEEGNFAHLFESNN